MVACSQCNTPMLATDRFCAQCGASKSKVKDKKDKRSIGLIIAFYGSMLLFLLISTFVYAQVENMFVTELTIEIIFIVLTVGFSIVDLKNILPLYSVKSIDTKALAIAVVFPLFTAFTVWYLIGELNWVLFNENPSMMEDYAYYNRPFLWAFIYISLVAPIFEELAFRGFLFNQVRAVASVRITIIATAFIFALIHLSLFSLLWIFPFGLALGYLRHKYRTLWLGMIVHFIHNTAVLVLDYNLYYDRWPLIHYFQ